MIAGVLVTVISLVFLFAYAYTHTFVVWTIGYMVTLILGVGMIVAGAVGSRE